MDRKVEEVYEAPDFEKFIEKNLKELRLDKVKVEEKFHYVQYFGKHDTEHEVLRFWMEITEQGKIKIVVPVNEPPREIPSWLVTFMKMHEECLSKWPNRPEYSQIIIVYVYKY